MQSKFIHLDLDLEQQRLTTLYKYVHIYERERERRRIQYYILYTTKMSTLITLYIVHECFEMTMSLYDMRMPYVYAS